MTKISRIKSAGAKGIVISGYGSEGKNLPIISPPQIDYRPTSDEEGVFIPIEDGYGYIGTLKAGTELNEGEIRLNCGGGYIYLRANGSVVINGVIITKEGKILGG